ncbi:MAG: type IV conjugative transfer system protein TraL [Rhodospirillales bacterium]|nr:type IV conjugative transfer system protein TraL [Rhodospirillales bacterium]
MADLARHAIPRRLDDPERWLFWTVDEAAVLMGPALLGLAANAFVTGLAAGIGGWLLLRRVKRGGGANIARYALYWALPDFVLRLQGTPPSHVRRYIG